MKKIIIIFILSALLIIAVGVWIYSTNEPISLSDGIHIIVIFLLVVFATFIAFNKFKSIKKGLPAEDELSKKIMEKAASKTFYISLYLWLALMYIGNEKIDDPEKLFGAGIIGMALIFALSWLYFKFKGLKSE
ncbi:MAG: DUF2178 domain-containing protein [Bacteroidales bacterium]|nr:DUF2178 domain-containing protein [Bacteroidales bacterium]